MQVLAIVRRSVLAACFALTAISILPGQAKASLLFDITAPGITTPLNQEARVAGSFIEFPGAMPDTTDIDFYFQALVEPVATASGFTVHFDENDIKPGGVDWSVDVINHQILELSLFATYVGLFGTIELLLTAGSTAGLAPNLGKVRLTDSFDDYLLTEFDVTFSPVPEPGSLILFLTGLGVIGLFLMRRRRFTA